MRLYGEMHRFLPAIASEMGVTITERIVNHRKRLHGASKYGISRTIRVVLDLLTVKFLISYSTRPLQIFGLLGLMMGSLGTLLCIWLAFVKYYYHAGNCRPAAAAGGDRTACDRRAVADERVDRRDAGADVSRVARQADLRDQGDSRGAGALAIAVARAGGHGRMRIGLWPRLSVAAIAVGSLGMAACGGSPNGPTPPPGNGGGPVTPPANVAPVIQSIVPSVERAEADTDVTVTATIEDVETPVSQLQLTWTVPGGVIVGQGATVTWHTPKDEPTPREYGITLTVTETYGTANAAGVRPQHVVTAQSPVVRVHNSPKELGDLSMAFLRDFANSSVPAEAAVRDFTDSCAGKADEFNDIKDNREDFDILGSSLNLRSVRVASNNLRGDMTVACSFTSRIKKCDAGDTKCVVGAVG